MKTRVLKVVVSLVLSLVAAVAPAAAQSYPFRDPRLPTSKRIDDLIGRLTIKEKASLLFDQSPAIPRLGIGKFNWWSEALHGLANNDGVTVFPEPIGMAASFNDALVLDIFGAVSDEVRAKYHDGLRRGGENRRFMGLSVWTPNVNIFRDPRWGRGQETYGEDPFLTSRMGVAVVSGLQGPRESKYRKLLACAKHFAVHSGPEWSRHELNLNNVAPRDLWETYLPAFKSLVQEADVREVMCAYQRLDDEPCCGSDRLLGKILREDWGYKHMVVSDCGAVTDFFTSHKVSSSLMHAASKALLAGTDVECVWDGYAYGKLPDALKAGLVDERDIDVSLRRTLAGRFELGEFDDDVEWAKTPMSVVNSEKHRRLALDMARQSMTLLQNKNGVLPLAKSTKKIAVVGPNADNEQVLWGNYNGRPVRTISILAGIKSKLGPGAVFYDKATDLVEDKVTDDYFARLSGGKGLRATYWNTREMTGNPVVSVDVDRPMNLTTAGQHEFATGVRLEGFSAKYEAVFEPKETEELVFKFAATGHFELLVNDASLVKYDNWRSLPSRVPFTFEAGKSYRIEIRYWQLNNWQAALNFTFGKEKDIDFGGLIAKLDGIDDVIYVGGLSGNLEGEEMPVSYPGFKGGDRTSIELPDVQRRLLRELKAAGKRVTFVNTSGSAIALAPETESCDAILQAWYGGESGGEAVADVLFGDYNPSGKLPVTFYKSQSQLPDFEDYSMKGRTYRFMSDALFPFGYGLSYTKFEIGTATASRTSVTNGETLKISVPVTNTGRRDGTEVVQVYVRKAGESPDGPLKTLRGFARIAVAAGRTATATIELPYTAFQFYDETTGGMRSARGDYELLYGSSSADKDLKKASVTVR